jgi:CubicO group peptidase (beta-lactamase class C family)
MTHTPGFPASLYWETLPGFLEYLDSGTSQPPAYPLLYPAGSEVTYSCIGFIILGIICEKISGKPLDKLADELVFNPLKLSRTGYKPLRRLVESGTKSKPPMQFPIQLKDAVYAKTEYDEKTNTCLSGIVHDEKSRILGGVSGNAGVFSDINDCSSFARLLANYCDGFISRDLFNESITNHTPGLSEDRGLGFKLFPDGSFGHTGFTGTYIRINRYTGRYMVLLSNRIHPSRDNDGIFTFREELYETCK